MATHVWTNAVKPSGLPSLPADLPVTITGNESIEFEAVVTAGTTTELDCGAIDRTKVVSFVLHSSAVAVTVNSNTANASGGQTFDLSVAKGNGWNNTMTFANPLTADITALFVINAGVVATTFRASFLLSV